jgi:hypothetical protein
VPAALRLLATDPSRLPRRPVIVARTFAGALSATVTAMP